MPTNILLDRIRTRRGLKWGLPAMLLGVGHMYLAAVCTVVLEHGGPGWLSVVVLWGCWNGLKFLLMGPWSLVLLVRARLAEAAQRRPRRDRVAEDPLPGPSVSAALSVLQAAGRRTVWAWK